MDKDTITLIAGVLGPAFLALIGFMAKSMLSGIRKDIKSVVKEVDKLDGRLTAMQADLRANTANLIQASAELKAVWRFVDRSHQRASDNGGIDG
jgi:hypothetical protein